MTAAALITVTLLLVGSLVALLGRGSLQLAALAVFPMALMALAIGATGAGSGWWAVDRVGAVLAAAALVIGACACRYAIRQFEGERRAGASVGSSCVVVAMVVATDLAATEVALTLSWVATSVATLLLLRAGSGSWRTHAVRRAAMAFGVVDAVLVGGTLLAAALPGHLSLLASLDRPTSLSGPAAMVVLAVAAIAAVGRAGLLPKASWVIGTVTTPTSISALLHAGVVNAGALLLLRYEVAAGLKWWLATALAAASLTTLLVLAPRIHTRIDLKGQLAASTISQMAFMLLALALGWPLLALTHLVGHGLYKAGRFMAAGGATEARATLRRRAPRGSVIEMPARLAGVAVLLVLPAGLGIWGRGDVLAAMGVVGPAAAVVWWTRSATKVERPGRSVVLLATGLLADAAVVAGAQYLLAASLPISGWQSPWWALGATVGIVSVITERRQRRPSQVDHGVHRMPTLTITAMGEVAA